MSEFDLEQERERCQRLFAHELGVTDVECSAETVGNVEFLKFHVGRTAPVYDQALRSVSQQLEDDHPYRGQLGLRVVQPKSFLRSLESDVLLGMLTRSTRTIVRGGGPAFPTVPYVSFPNNEDQRVVQPASQLIVGRRGVGKSTLIMRALDLLSQTRQLCVVMDLQAYSAATDESVLADVLADFTSELGRAVEDSPHVGVEGFATELMTCSESLAAGDVTLERAPIVLNRLISKITRALGVRVYAFFDDVHTVAPALQPRLIHLLHGALKGADGWLKIAGVRSLLNHWDAATRMGLQHPADAEIISLDFTLEDPEAAEKHLEEILLTFLQPVGVDSVSTLIHAPALRRLVWANAGVPRDFLRMLSSAITHARRADRARVVRTDANLAIGELGQSKMTELDEDARYEGKKLRDLLTAIEQLCLEDEKINAFLVAQDAKEYVLIQNLSDLRLVHLLHRTITPHKAGERYEAYILDYSLFTGFRRRPNVREMLPSDGKSFKAAELRTLPALPADLLGA